MMYLTGSITIATTTADAFYLPVPCRGIVKDVWLSHNEETDADEIWTVARGATTVNTITTPADATAEGTSVQGVPDTTSKDLVFDPDSTTVANRVIRINTLNTVDTGGSLGYMIAYDPSCAIAQAASEA